MTLRFFHGKTGRKRHETEQLAEMSSAILGSGIHSEESPIVILSDFRLDNSQIDCLLLTRHAMIVIDFKAYRGVILGDENRPWSVETESGTIKINDGQNVLEQANFHRIDFRRRLYMIAKTSLPTVSWQTLSRVGSWAYFLQGSFFPDDQINFRAVPWFRVVTKDTIVDEIESENAGYTLFPEDMEAIVEAIGLEEYWPRFLESSKTQDNDRLPVNMPLTRELGKPLQHENRDVPVDSNDITPSHQPSPRVTSSVPRKVPPIPGTTVASCYSGKYRALYTYLRDNQGVSVLLTFSDVEKLLGFSLPASAYKYQVWWRDRGPTHSHNRAWLDAGWEVVAVTPGSSVKFARGTGGPSGSVIEI